jgi:hypothetical protein
MLVAGEYAGLDLPFYDSEVHVLTGSDLRNGGIQRVGDSHALPATFVRAIRGRLPSDERYHPDTVEELLKVTDQELAVVAELCGGLVVAHEWGMHSLKGKDEDVIAGYDLYLKFAKIINLPEDHILCAKVDTIEWIPTPENTSLNPEELLAYLRQTRMNVKEGMREYYRRNESTSRLNDMRREQFMNGTPVGVLGGEVQTYLVDIEPHFALGPTAE